MVVRDAYLSERQMKKIEIWDNQNELDAEGDRRRRLALEAAGRVDGSPFFFLYEEKDMHVPAACYFTGEEVIIPTALDRLTEKIYKGMRLASRSQTMQLRSLLNRFVRSDGTVTELGLSFLASVDCLLGREDGQLIKYKMLFQRTENFSGYSYPVWSYSLKDEKGGMESWEKLYREYGLVPNVKEILDWLHSLAETKTAKLTKEQYGKLKEYYLKVDRERLGNPYYSLSKGIFDDGQCWDVFEKGQPDADKVRCIFPDGEWLSAEAPSESIVGDGFVSIDFGTKSTVLVISEQAAGGLYFYTLKFGQGRSGENPLHPTVLKFIGLEEFLEAYESESGRPDTLWSTVSIDDSKCAGGRSDSALGIFRSLKQWMVDPNAGEAVLRQKDAPDKPIMLKEYGSCENSIDPIELYAYYLGLHVNNNKGGKIFIRYRLSFSEVCSEQIQHSMRASFQRGLAKSLPASIVNSSAMDNFSVTCTCSEPAAYAVCALACMGMPGKCRGNFFYGIFDFGGGTCDFNYGVWMSERDAYKIIMLDDGGDPFLGGENLLELLAVEVVRMCMKMEGENCFKKRGYKISRPRCYEGGKEEFFASSFEAAYNLELLADMLRKLIWENPDESKDEIDIKTAGLLPEMRESNDSNKEKPEKNDSNFASGILKLPRRPLEELLEKRIYEGVSAFFHTFYRMVEEHGQDAVPQLCVFLAGNSCRSKLVRKMFEKYIKEEPVHTYIQQVYLCNPMGSSDFEKHVPMELWTEGQREKMCTNILRLGDLDGKTGVAYGLALYGNQVKIENRRVKDRLLYYLGTSRFLDIKMLKGERDNGLARLTIGEIVPFSSSGICNLYYTKRIPKEGVLSGTRMILLNGQNVPMGRDATCYVRVNSRTEISIFAAPDGDPENHNPKDELIIELK